MKFGMMKPRRRNRLLLVLSIVVSSGVAVAFVVSALNQNMNLFYSPAQIVAGEAPTGRNIRAGGMVLAGSVERATESLAVSFRIGDLKDADVLVRYEGILPDLFREGQGIIAEGELRPDGSFAADTVLAKHDENYMPPEVESVLAEAHGDAGVALPDTRRVPGDDSE